MADAPMPDAADFMDDGHLRPRLRPRRHVRPLRHRPLLRRERRRASSLAATRSRWLLSPLATTTTIAVAATSALATALCLAPPLAATALQLYCTV